MPGDGKLDNEFENIETPERSHDSQRGGGARIRFPDPTPISFPPLLRGCRSLSPNAAARVRVDPFGTAARADVQER